MCLSVYVLLCSTMSVCNLLKASTITSLINAARGGVSGKYLTIHKSMLELDIGFDEVCLNRLFSVPFKCQSFLLRLLLYSW